MCFTFSAIIIDHPTFSGSRHHESNNNAMFDGNMKILNDGFFTNIDSRAYIVSKIDLDEWEKMHGRIPNGALVILRSGWSQYYNQPDEFFGNFADQDKQVFPGNVPKIMLLHYNLVYLLCVSCYEIIAATFCYLARLQSNDIYLCYN